MPLLVAAAVLDAALLTAVSATSLACLVILGGSAAKAGGASIVAGALRVALWGALAMAVTAGAAPAACCYEGSAGMAMRSGFDALIARVDHPLFAAGIIRGGLFLVTRLVLPDRPAADPLQTGRALPRCWSLPG